jgi:hypothetical protein
VSASTWKSRWPPELAFLLERHPRSRWGEEQTPDVTFWLGVHAHLRHDCAALEAAADDHRRGRTTAAQLAVIAGARFRSLEAALHGHHQIEDFHYFPAFRAVEPRLAAGFDRLEADHAALARDAAAVQEALAALRAAVERAEAGSASAFAAERFGAAAGRLSASLLAHLADEEDLVVPLMIERRDG